MKSFSKQLITFLLFFALTPLCLLGALETKPWTIMVYMLGDNDLEESAVDDLNEMLSADTGKNVNLVILADRGSNYSQANVGGIKSWKTPKLLTSASSKSLRPNFPPNTTACFSGTMGAVGRASASMNPRTRDCPLRLSARE